MQYVKIGKNLIPAIQSDTINSDTGLHNYEWIDPRTGVITYITQEELYNVEDDLIGLKKVREQLTDVKQDIESLKSEIPQIDEFEEFRKSYQSVSTQIEKRLRAYYEGLMASGEWVDIPEGLKYKTVPTLEIKHRVTTIGWLIDNNRLDLLILDTDDDLMFALVAMLKVNGDLQNVENLKRLFFSKLKVDAKKVLATMSKEEIQAAGMEIVQVKSVSISKDYGLDD